MPESARLKQDIISSRMSTKGLYSLTITIPSLILKLMLEEDPTLAILHITPEDLKLLAHINAEKQKMLKTMIGWPSLLMSRILEEAEISLSVHREEGISTIVKASGMIWERRIYWET